MCLELLARGPYGKTPGTSPWWRSSAPVGRYGPVPCLDEGMTGEEESDRVVSATREIGAGGERNFEFIAEPSQQPHWHGNDNLAAGVGAGDREIRVGNQRTVRLPTQKPTRAPSEG